MKEYVCKIASFDEMEAKWNYEIAKHKNEGNWTVWKNLIIYQKYGFNEYIKSAQEKYPDGTVIDVDYYGKNI